MSLRQGQTLQGILRVGVNLVSHGRLEELAETLRCVAALSPAAYRVCVVDNASPDRRQLAQLRRQHPDFQWFCLSSNLGFGAGHHIGMQWLLAEGCEALLLLNPDLRFGPKVLSEFATVSAAWQHRALLGPLLLQEEGIDPKLDSAGLRLDAFFRAIDQGQGRLRSEYLSVPQSQASSLPVWGLCGAALWIPSQLLPLSPSRFCFAPDFFAYFEDVELAYCCHQLGIDLRILPGVPFVHRRGGFGKLSALTTADWTARQPAVRGALLNRLHTWRRHVPSWRQFPGFWPWELIRWSYLFLTKPCLRPLLLEAWQILTGPVVADSSVATAPSSLLP